MSARFELKATASGGARFTYQDSGGRVVLTSQGYRTPGAARDGIESIRANAMVDDRYERLMARSGHPYFNLKAANGQIIGTSVLFGSPQERHDAIEAMQQEAADAPVHDAASGD